MRSRVQIVKVVFFLTFESLRLFSDSIVKHLFVNDQASGDSMFQKIVLENRHPWNSFFKDICMRLLR